MGASPLVRSVHFPLSSLHLLMDPKSLIESALVDVEPMLRAAGRSVAVKEASDTHCVVELKGFCGDCACSGSYMEGIQDLVREKIPSIKNIEFVQS